jgi:1-acyl-sn-glycerol-3-phosphate acyltransferase
MFPIALLIWLVTLPFDRRGWLLHKFTCFWAAMFTWPNPHWNVTIENADRADRRATYVIVSNHLSLVDIPVVFRLFLHFKWVSKAENFKIPFVGWNMRLNRYIQLDRGSNKSNAKMLRACERALAGGSSIYIFPEGTRSTNGRVSGFKRGAFELAKRAGTAILPIVIDGSAEALPKHGLMLRGFHRIKVRVLDPIPAASFADATVEELTDRVRNLIRTEHESMIAARA